LRLPGGSLAARLGAATGSVPLTGAIAFAPSGKGALRTCAPRLRRTTTYIMHDSISFASIRQAIGWQVTRHRQFGV
jgi:hypothetical protein